MNIRKYSGLPLKFEKIKAKKATNFPKKATNKKKRSYKFSIF